jgi:hypothetical protein
VLHNVELMGATPTIYRTYPVRARSHCMHAHFKFQSPQSNMDNISYNDRIELAITNLESQITLNYAATAKKHNIDRSTLSRRYRDAITSKVESLSKIHKALTDV